MLFCLELTFLLFMCIFIYAFSVGYSLAVSQYIVKKFILLVVFLDHAKLTRLIDHDPCLFQLTSSVKASNLMRVVYVNWSHCISEVHVSTLIAQVCVCIIVPIFYK